MPPRRTSRNGSSRSPTAGPRPHPDSGPPLALPGRWGAALYHCRIDHLRTHPLCHAFTHHTYLWLVDLDHLPRLPPLLHPLARFHARDHLGHPSRSLRANLDRFLATHGIDLEGGQVLMLAHARSLGHVFNPLTLYWCHDRRGTPTCTVAEVCNTYGERHCYLLRPDPAGYAESDKTLYVSPFSPLDGSYRLRLPRPHQRLQIAIHLERAGIRNLTATLTGTRTPANPSTLLRAALRYPLSTLAVSAHIRLQGIRLYLRGAPRHPRPSHRSQEGVGPHDPAPPRPPASDRARTC